MAEIIWLQRHRVARLLVEAGGARLAIRVAGAGVVPLNVIRHAIPPMNVQLFDDHIEFDATISGQRVHVSAEWRDVLQSLPLNPPSGDGGQRKAA